MIHEMKAGWAQLRRSPAGQRFQEYHERREGGGKSTRRWMLLGIGWLLVLAGVVLLLIPGPGIPVLALGLAIFARESRYVARLLDAAEIRIRRLLSAAQKLWRRSSVWAKVAMTLTAIVLVGALSVGAYKVTFGN